VPPPGLFLGVLWHEFISPSSRDLVLAAMYLNWFIKQNLTVFIFKIQFFLASLGCYLLLSKQPSSDFRSDTGIEKL